MEPFLLTHPLVQNCQKVDVANLLLLVCLKPLLVYYSDHYSNLKLDGVAPLMTDPPTTNFTSFSKKIYRKYKEKKEEKNCDTGHLTCDTGHLTCDT